ncbi:MAG: hypothetical protein KDD69_18015, partial [Bdellovibrionales bacterium]|nr:hypothetical protein [Bdellovibrionales bacterium]
GDARAQQPAEPQQESKSVGAAPDSSPAPPSVADESAFRLNLRHYLSYDSSSLPSEGEQYESEGYGGGLDLSNTEVEDADLAQLTGSAFRGVRWLNLRGTAVSDDGLKHLKPLPLRTLVLESTEIDGRGFTELKGLPLKMLILEDTKLEESNLAKLKGLPIEFLDLTGADVTDEGLLLLRGLPLKSLNLYSTRVTDAGLQYLPLLQLRKVYLTGAQVTDEAVEELKRNHPELEVIY